MVKNMSQADKLIRILIAAAIFILLITGTVSGVLAIFLGILGVVMVVTGLVGTCPLYMLLNISSRKKSA